MGTTSDSLSACPSALVNGMSMNDSDKPAEFDRLEKTDAAQDAFCRCSNRTPNLKAERVGPASGSRCQVVSRPPSIITLDIQERSTTVLAVAGITGTSLMMAPGPPGSAIAATERPCCLSLKGLSCRRCEPEKSARRVSGRFCSQPQTPNSSTSNSKVALGGITPPAPAAP